MNQTFPNCIYFCRSSVSTQILSSRLIVRLASQILMFDGFLTRVLCGKLLASIRTYRIDTYPLLPQAR
jgi:hypothetical protein